MPTARTLSSATRLGACAALLAFASAAGAQQSVVIAGGGGGTGTFTFGSAKLPISDDAVRAILIAHNPEVFDATTEPQAVVIVVDANDQYVSSKISKTTVITAGGDTASHFRTVLRGDSTSIPSGSVSITVRRDSSGAAHLSSGGGAGGGVMMSHMSFGDGDAFGSGYGASDVSVMSMKRYAAGALATAPVIVSIVKLK